MELKYGNFPKERIKIIVDTCIYLNHYQQFHFEEGFNEIEISIYEDLQRFSKKKGPENLELIKKSILNINGFTVDHLNKSIYTLNEINIDKKKNLNLITSEVEVSTVISTEKVKKYQFDEINKKYYHDSHGKIEDFLYKMPFDDKIRKLETDKYLEKFTKDISNSLTLEHIINSSLYKRKDQWKESF